MSDIVQPQYTARRGSTVVLLGAGASWDAGLPMANALTERAIKALGSGNTSMYRRPLDRALSYVVSAIQMHDIRNGARDLAPVGIERLVSAVKMLDERNSLEVSPFVHAWDPLVTEMAAGKPEVSSNAGKKLGDLIGAHVKSMVGRPLAHPPAQSYQSVMQEALDSYATAHLRPGIFGDLHRWLVDQVVLDLQVTDPQQVNYLTPLTSWAARSGAVIATLNYDLCVELSAELRGIGVDIAVQDWQETGALREPEDSQVRLLKLHGSVDWRIDDQGDSFIVGEPAEDAQRSAFQQLSPALIYGQRGKLRPAGPFLQLLEAFRAALYAADRLVVIGYSFGDDHITGLISSWMRRNPQAHTLIVDPGIRYPRSARPSVMSMRDQFLLNFGPRRQWQPLPGTTIPGRVHPVVGGAKEAIRYFDQYSSDPSLEGLFDRFPSYPMNEAGTVSDPPTAI